MIEYRSSHFYGLWFSLSLERYQSGAMFQIRPAQESEARRIRRMVRAARLNPLSLDWRQFIVARDEKGVVRGCGQVKHHRDGSRELASLVVEPGWRRQGIAGRIIQAIQTNEPPPLWLTCRSGLIPYYQRFGFIEITTPEDMPPYFRRVYRLVGVLLRSARPGDYLAVMCWNELEVNSR